jgi:prefoldin subunit 5
MLKCKLFFEDRVNQNIIINIGLDIYIEMTLKNAIEYLDSRKTIYQKKLIYFNGLISRNEDHYQKTNSILTQLKMQIEIDK